MQCTGLLQRAAFLWFNRLAHLITLRGAVRVQPKLSGVELILCTEFCVLRSKTEERAPREQLLRTWKKRRPSVHRPLDQLASHSPSKVAMKQEGGSRGLDNASHHKVVEGGRKREGRSHVSYPSQPSLGPITKNGIILGSSRRPFLPVDEGGPPPPILALEDDRGMDAPDAACSAGSEEAVPTHDE